ncbi:hypothetical protein [Sphingomonas sp.]|uniref:hypothetical protein n=1 Tax=Sphingomonas sp. TaxID=28214 RepID=UPI000BD2BBB2|nr:hypothetical protein [Sphingomonas sp.]MBA4762243.1 hypothetical protein [Sphingomonas sp.]OYX49920.1 MAG: hypothetical protein B7Y97_08395 [Sphingomonas sp. 32-66-10]
MAGPLLLIPAVVVGALIAYVKLHAAHISMMAAGAAVAEFVKTRDFDLAAAAALAAGADAAAGDLVGDFFRLRWG